MITCKSDKCLVYPVCKSRKHVACDVLYNHCHEIHEMQTEEWKENLGEIKSIEALKLYVKDIKEIFPNVVRITNPLTNEIYTIPKWKL